MRYRPELDGLRAFAVIAVLLGHVGTTITLGGWMGVDVFFVLSGFLITSILLGEHKKFNSINLKQFYIRRALRLYPALLLLLLGGLLFYRELGDRPSGQEFATLAGYGVTALIVGTYMMDFAFGLTGNPFGEMSHTWSLAVEEQFYLLWPISLILLLRHRKKVLNWTVGMTLASLLIMLALLPASLSGVPDYAYYLPFSRFWELTLGCSVALVLNNDRMPRVAGSTWFGAVAIAVAAVTYLVGAYIGGFVLAYPRAGGGPFLGLLAPLIAIATAALLFHLTARRDGTLTRLLSSPPLVYIGRRSYGLYLYHFPILVILESHLHARRAVVTLVMLAVTMVLAELSYRFVELPLLRLKKRFSPMQGAFANSGPVLAEQQPQSAEGETPPPSAS